MTATATATSTVTPSRGVRSNRLFSALIGLAALVVLMQAVWAGIFLAHDGERDASAGWIDVHSAGGEVAILLTALATAVAVIKHRSRKDLWIGSAILTLLLVLEAYLGGLIRDGQDTLTAVHIPLAMALTGLVVWLPLRASRRS